MKFSIGAPNEMFREHTSISDSRGSTAVKLAMTPLSQPSERPHTYYHIYHRHYIVRNKLQHHNTMQRKSQSSDCVSVRLGG